MTPLAKKASLGRLVTERIVAMFLSPIFSIDDRLQNLSLWSTLMADLRHGDNAQALFASSLSALA